MKGAVALPLLLLSACGFHFDRAVVSTCNIAELRSVRGELMLRCDAIDRNFQTAKRLMQPLLDRPFDFTEYRHVDLAVLDLHHDQSGIGGSGEYEAWNHVVVLDATGIAMLHEMFHVYEHAVGRGNESPNHHLWEQKGFYAACADYFGLIEPIVAPDATPGP